MESTGTNWFTPLNKARYATEQRLNDKPLLRTYQQYHEYRTKGLVADTTSRGRTDGHVLHVKKFLFCSESVKTATCNILEQACCSGVTRNFGREGVTNSVEDRENGDLGGGSPPSQGFWRQL